MSEFLRHLTGLGLLMCVNIALGLWSKIGIENLSFDLRKLLGGILKAAVAGLAFFSLAYTAELIDLSTYGIDSKAFLVMAIGTYACKVVQNLGKILGIKTNSSIEHPSQTEEGGSKHGIQRD